MNRLSGLRTKSDPGVSGCHPAFRASRIARRTSPGLMTTPCSTQLTRRQAGGRRPRPRCPLRARHRVQRSTDKGRHPRRSCGFLFEPAPRSLSAQRPGIQRRTTEGAERPRCSADCNARFGSFLWNTTAPDSTGKPLGKLLSADLSISEPQEQGFLFIHARNHFKTVQNQEHLHGGVPNTFIPVDEGVVHHQRVGERRGLRLH